VDRHDEEPVDIEIVARISDIECIAAGRGVREAWRLATAYEPGRWRKMKGLARVRLAGGVTRLAEVHWYEAHGIGCREYKIKRFLEDAR
jgi:hypothetical protein